MKSCSSGVETKQRRAQYNGEAGAVVRQRIPGVGERVASEGVA